MLAPRNTSYVVKNVPGYLKAVSLQNTLPFDGGFSLAAVCAEVTRLSESGQLFEAAPKPEAQHVKTQEHTVFQTCGPACALPAPKRNNNRNGPGFCLDPSWEGAGFCLGSTI